MKWQEFVKTVQKKHSISYKEALTKSSPLWKEYKVKNSVKPKKKKSRKKRVVEAAPEISEFPKIKDKKKGSRKSVARTETRVVNDLGGNIGAEIDRRREKVKPKGRPRLRKKHSILLDSAYKYAARKSRIR